MELDLHSEFKIKKLTIGDEKAPLMVVDNLFAQADVLLEYANKQSFARNSNFYPGVRSEAPVDYKKRFMDVLHDVLIDYFDLSSATLKFDICQYSLVTAEPSKLHLLQRIPHFDSTDKNGLAAVHYLFKGDLGGTAFYRHKKTGFEYITEERKLDYFRALESENGTGNIPASGYINGDTPLFEQVGKQEGVFNRVVIYRRNSLHSGSISENFVPDANPLTGRLSINSFIDVA